METLDIARKLAAYGETAGACKGYGAAISQGLNPAEELEAAAYILQFGREYQIAYTSFLSLYRQRQSREIILPILDAAFYQPNVKNLQKNYEKNCKLLKKYPYFFRKDFLDFEELPIRLFPYDDHSYIPFDLETQEFGDMIDLQEPVIRHNFFRDLENPILAEDIFSQYELEYLNDNVRKSEYVAKENHIYLHYTNWVQFCAYLQCLNLRILLADEKFVFLIEEDISQYPIDFKTRFDVDYSQYPVKPLGIREVNRMIWHTQLSSHNGGDFFNEIFDGHPNLLMKSSLLLDKVEELIQETEQCLMNVNSEREAEALYGQWAFSPRWRELYRLRKRTAKDILVALFFMDNAADASVDASSRIAPALFFQPHFEKLDYQMELDDKGRAALVSKQYDQIKKSPIFRSFKYIKTFTPMRRMTTSHGGTVRFMQEQTLLSQKTDDPGVFDDAVFIRIVSRSFMIDPQDRLYKDSVLVRFEDGKLNPKATFTALASFLDLPYTKSMSYCSAAGKRDPHPETKGFDPVTVYRTYDDFVNNSERILLEYFLRDAYAEYGYDFQYYDGNPMDEEQVKALIAGCTTINRYIRDSYRFAFRKEIEEKYPDQPEEHKTAETERIVDEIIDDVDKNRLRIAKILLHGLKFVNRQGQPLRMMPRLTLDPALLEQPLYH